MVYVRSCPYQADSVNTTSIIYRPLSETVREIFLHPFVIGLPNVVIGSFVCVCVSKNMFLMAYFYIVYTGKKKL